MNNYNRYAYCLNNPLRYTDPSGYQYHRIPDGYSWQWINGGWKPVSTSLLLFTVYGSPRSHILSEEDLYLEFGMMSVGEGPSIVEEFLTPPSLLEMVGKPAGIGGGGKGTTVARVPEKLPVRRPWVVSSQGYEAGIVSQNKFHNTFTPMENIGALGGYNLSFYSKTYQGADRNWYVETSATAYAPHAEKMSDKVSYFGTTEMIVEGEVISRSNFRVPTDNNSYIVTQGHTWLGNTYHALPINGNAQLKITISYNSYQFWNGHAYPVNPYRYTINYR